MGAGKTGKAHETKARETRNELNETFPGLDPVNGFYTPYYMQEFFPAAVTRTAARWKDLPAKERPAARVRDLGVRFAAMVNGTGEDAGDDGGPMEFVDAFLAALGYAVPQTDAATSEAGGNAAAAPRTVKDPRDGVAIPLHVRVDDAQGAPLLVALAVRDDADTGVLEGTVASGDGQGHGGQLICEDVIRRLLGDLDEPPRWVLAVGLHQAVLVDRRKWADRKCMVVDFDTVYSRREPRVFEAVAVLMHHDVLCPADGGSPLDDFDDESSRQSVAVSDSLRSALRECVEILGNEVIHDWTVNKGRAVGEMDAGELTVQCLRYMYRLLFLLFIEAKPDLGYAPMNAEAYRTAYSLESLRDLAERMRGRMDEAEDTDYLARTLRQLDRMVFDGYPSTEGELRKVMNMQVTEGVFAVPPLKAHIFDPERTALIENARLRDSVMLRIVDLMSVTNAGTSGRNGGRGRRQRISYAALGISQMGAVYEALLSYRGFIATQTLYEVKRAKDSFDELNVGYFVTADQLEEYGDDERVYYTSGPLKGRLRSYAPGTFIYRLAGRERETSASFYTPDSLAECLVRYALKEIEPRIHEATDILSLRICEPAMGSATFLNETINQLAAWYLRLREKERVAKEGPRAAIPAERRQAELQRVRMFIADRCIYGVDLNPIAVELGEVSLWLNTICEGSFVPWFGTQLQCGNSLIGARRTGYLESQLTTKTKNMHWWEVEPKRIGFDSSSSRAKRVYRFLLGDPGMCSYEKDKTIKAIESGNVQLVKDWRKRFTAPCTPGEVKMMRELSKTVDQLWRGQIKARRDLERDTRDKLGIYGYADTDRSFDKLAGKERDGQAVENTQGSLDAASFATENLTIREKDELLGSAYRSERARNASEYARLKLAMDYWCALWFWPLDHAEQLPDRTDYLTDMSMILNGGFNQDEFHLVYEHDQLTFDEAELEQSGPRDYARDHTVNLDELRNSDKPIGERIRLVERIAREQRFFHWELEFADVFKDGGFDLMIGNPPWVNVQWSEADAISDVNPLFAIHTMSAAKLSRRMPELLENEQVHKTLVHEYVGIAGSLAFYGSLGNYPLLQGQRTNLFRCFLPNAFDFTRPKGGVSAFVHPDELYGDTRAGVLRWQMVRRLRYHFQFINERKLFAGVDHHTTFSLNVYRNPESGDTPIRFDSIWNLYEPKTIDACYASDGSGSIPTIKDEETGTWNIRGHRDRIITVDEDVLRMFAKLVGDGTEDSWPTTPIIGAYVRELVTALERMAAVPKALRDYDKIITYSPMWNETNARKDGTIKDDIHFPGSDEPVIYSSPFIGVGNPIMQSTRRRYKVNSDYDFVDLTTIGEDYEPRVKYAQACSNAEYQNRVPKLADGSRLDAVYRVACRRMVSLTGERTLQASGVHPGVAWVNTVTGYGVHPDHYDLLTLMMGLEATLPYDFLVRSIGKTDIHNATLQLFPIPEDSPFAKEIRLRGLLLNCLTKPYADLWEDCWDDAYPTLGWAKEDPRLNPERFTGLAREWDWHTPLRTDYERRQALVELDVLASMALGLTLDELIDIYRFTFTALKDNEDNTWYDVNGRVVSSKKNYGALAYKGTDFAKIKDAEPGEEFTRTISDDTRPGGPVDRTITYVAPFDRCDRIADYRAAWSFFAHKYNL